MPTDHGWTIEPGTPTTYTNGDAWDITSPSSLAANFYVKLNAFTGPNVNTVGATIDNTGNVGNREILFPAGGVQTDTFGISTGGGSTITHWIISAGAAGNPSVVQAIFTATDGKLKINVGTALAPDIRTIGCDGAAEAYPTAANEVNVYDRGDGTLVALANQLTYTATTILDMNLDGVAFYFTFVSGSTSGHSLWSSSNDNGGGIIRGTGDSVGYSGFGFAIFCRDGAMNYLGNAFPDSPVVLASPPPGRLKLYADGRIWQEVCDDDTGPTFTDDFNRSDSTSSVSNAAWANWTSDTASASLYVWGIRSGNAYANGPFSGAPNILYYGVGTTDYDFTATYTGASGKDPWVGLVFSFDTASGGSFRVWTNNGIGGFDSGGGTGMIQTGFPSIVAGDVLRVVCVGLSIELFLNGVSVSTITNTWADTGGATRVGLYGSTGDMGGQWDDVIIIAGLEKHPLEIDLPGGVTAAVCMTPV